MLQIRGYRLMCGFSAFGGLAVFRQADELVPPPTWGRDGGASGLAPTWPGSGGRGGGVPCPVAPRAPRAGQRPRPRPGEGRAVGGAGRRLRPSFGGPQPTPGGWRHTPPGGIYLGTSAKKSVLRGAVHLGPNKSSFCGQGHLLRHRSRFHALLGWDWRKMNNWFPSALIPPHSPAFYCFCS